MDYKENIVTNDGEMETKFKDIITIVTSSNIVYNEEQLKLLKEIINELEREIEKIKKMGSENENIHANNEMENNLNASKNTMSPEEVIKSKEPIISEVYQIINSNNNNTKVDVENGNSNKTYEIDVCKKYFELLFGMRANNSKSIDYLEKEADGASVIYTSKTINNEYMLLLKMLANKMHEKIVIQGETQILIISPNEATISKRQRLENHIETFDNNTYKNNYGCSDSDFKLVIADDSNERAKTGSYGCNVCSKTFTTKYKLKLHKKFHTVKGPHVCKICKKVFGDNYSLKRHHKTHSEDNFYLCDFCGLKFVRMIDFNKHYTNHTGKLPYACDICDKPFGQVFTMRRHRRIHTGEKPFTCDVCHISFLRTTDLSIHYRKHTGEKPYSCTICGLLFSRKSTMVEHRRRHTGDRPYKCDLCIKSFITSSKRLHHMRNVHV